MTNVKLSEKQKDVMIEIEQSIESLKIKFNGLVFVCIKRDALIGFQSWRENSKYCIEFTCADANILTEYDNRELWERVLKELDKGYIF
jgi:hypothetical protein